MTEIYIVEQIVECCIFNTLKYTEWRRHAVFQFRNTYSATNFGESVPILSFASSWLLCNISFKLFYLLYFRNIFLNIFFLKIFCWKYFFLQQTNWLIDVTFGKYIFEITTNIHLVIWKISGHRIDYMLDVFDGGSHTRWQRTTLIQKTEQT